MKQAIISRLSIALVILSIVAAPTVGRTQQAAMQDEEPVFFAGSILLSLLHFPLKLVTCAGTQATAAVAYTATFGVAGNYDGGTNGKQIGEVARRSCTGPWLITPQQVRTDYGD